MAVNAFRGQVGNAQVYDTALVRISEAFRKAEDDQGVIIPDAIRLFLRRPPEILWPRNEREHRTVKVREADAPLVDLLNTALMTRAVWFLSTRENSPSIAQRFDWPRLDKSLAPVVIAGSSAICLPLFRPSNPILRYWGA